MGTRGKFGFFHKGKLYLCYNHFDSYPSYLGVHLILEIIRAGLDEWIKLLEDIKQVSYEMEATPEEAEKMKKYTDLTVSTKSPKDWYCLLSLTQGSFYHVLNSGYMVNVKGIDMGEQYTYVLDFDKKILKAKGYKLDVEIKLDKEELMKYAREWSEGMLNENYDPEEELAKMRKMCEAKGTHPLLFSQVAI